MKERRHVSASIEGLLSLTNHKLGRIVSMDGRKARRELLQRQAKGEKLIPSEGCEGFCPVNGCPGHKIEE